MNRLTVFALGDVLLFCSYDASASMGDTADPAVTEVGRRAAEQRPNTSLQDFNHAIAVQATPDQVSQFQTMAKSTEAARKQAQELLQLASKADRSADFTRQTTALKDALEDAQGGNKYFVKSFSKSQKAGLKELTKKLEKADSEVAKQRKALDQQVGRSKTDSAGIAGTADKLEKALEEFQSQQLGLAKEMGIQTPAM